ncbi:MAG: hypothetical protein WD894_03010 [Pirellulales bacterium]
MPKQTMQGLTICALFVGLLTAFSGFVRPQEPPPEKAQSAEKSGTDHEFEGLSDRRSFDEALADALSQMDKAVAEKGRFPCTKVTWRVVETGGVSGSPAGLNKLQVKIAASFETRRPD